MELTVPIFAEWATKMKHMTKRITMALCGVCLTAIGIAILKTADLGIDPFSCLTLGMGRLTGLSYGTIFTIVTFVLTIGVLVVDRHYIGLSSIMNLLFTGIIADTALKFLHNWYPDPSMPAKLLLLCAALLVLCFGASLYFTADLGVSAYDAWALILTDRKLAPFRICRIGTDTVCTAAGLLMGIMPGIGTLIAAFGMGPIIELFNQKAAIPLLEKNWTFMRGAKIKPLSRP